MTVWQCDTDINILCLCTPVCHSRAAGSPGLMTGCETEPVAEVKVKESPATILMLSSNSDWENNSPPSPEGVMLLCQSPAGLSAVWLSWLVSLSHCHTRTGYCNIGLMMWLWGGPTCDWPVAPCHCTPPLCTLAGNTVLAVFSTILSEFPICYFSPYYYEIIRRMWEFYKYLAPSRTMSLSLINKLNWFPAHKNIQVRLTVLFY